MIIGADTTATIFEIGVVEGDAAAVMALRDAAVGRLRRHVGRGRPAEYRKYIA